MEVNLAGERAANRYIYHSPFVTGSWCHLDAGSKVIILQKSERDPTAFRVARTWLLSSRLGDDSKELVGRMTAFHFSRKKLLSFC